MAGVRRNRNIRNLEQIRDNNVCKVEKSFSTPSLPTRVSSPQKVSEKEIVSNLMTMLPNQSWEGANRVQSEKKSFKNRRNRSSKSGWDFYTNFESDDEEEDVFSCADSEEELDECNWTLDTCPPSFPVKRKDSWSSSVTSITAQSYTNRSSRACSEDLSGDYLTPSASEESREGRAASMVSNALSLKPKAQKQHEQIPYVLVQIFKVYLNSRPLLSGLGKFSLILGGSFLLLESVRSTCQSTVQPSAKYFSLFLALFNAAGHTVYSKFSSAGNGDEEELDEICDENEEPIL